MEYHWFLSIKRVIGGGREGTTPPPTHQYAFANIFSMISILEKPYAAKFYDFRKGGLKAFDDLGHAGT